jgi:hypothetical protein
LSFENRYSWADRALHKLAFKSGGMQVALADIEDQLFKAEIAAANASRPVFVTALPRAGTTILLTLLAKTGAFASHTYRDMPFVLCPLLWNAMIRRFQVRDVARERAHGDGLMVAADSPEAFEEMLWVQFWPDHYKDSHIEEWSSCDDSEFLDFFRRHLGKVVLLRAGANASTCRYVSKNNLNIARLAALPVALPDAKIIVPFRDPVQHAASLLKQHLAFLEAHRGDVFASEYMRGVGHFDFGVHLRPINFDGWLARDRRGDAQGLAFWLEYWIAAYRAILGKLGPCVQLVSYRQLTRNPEATLEWLADFIELENPTVLIAQANELRAPREHEPDTSSLSGALLEEAHGLYGNLERAAAR